MKQWFMTQRGFVKIDQVSNIRIKDNHPNPTYSIVVSGPGFQDVTLSGYFEERDDAKRAIAWIIDAQNSVWDPVGDFIKKMETANV